MGLFSLSNSNSMSVKTIGGRRVGNWEGGQTNFDRGGVVFGSQGGNKRHLSEGGKGGNKRGKYIKKLRVTKLVMSE